MDYNIEQTPTALLVNDGKKTILTLEKNHNVRVKAYDDEEKKWLDAVLRWDGEIITAEDVDRNSEWQGMQWNVEQSDLLDNEQFRLS